MTADDLFAPPLEEWNALHPNYRKQLRLGALISWGIVALVILVPLTIAGFQWDAPWVLVIGVAIPLILLVAFRVWRQQAIYAAWGYAERDSDLYIRKGVWTRKLTVIPYGRMQAVEVKADPIQRFFKLASVQLVTASPQSDAIIPGLPADEAVELRDRLTLKGETQAAGL